MIRRNFIAFASSSLLTALGLKQQSQKEEMAIIEGEKYFIINGEIVRIEKNGSKTWYKNGVKHREDSYAYEVSLPHYNRKEWYSNGILHRDAGPAIVVTITDRMYDIVERREVWYNHGEFVKVNRVHKGL